MNRSGRSALVALSTVLVLLSVATAACTTAARTHSSEPDEYCAIGTYQMERALAACVRKPLGCSGGMDGRPVFEYIESKRFGRLFKASPSW